MFLVMGDEAWHSHAQVKIFSRDILSTRVPYFFMLIRSLYFPAQENAIFDPAYFQERQPGKRRLVDKPFPVTEGGSVFSPDEDVADIGIDLVNKTSPDQPGNKCPAPFHHNTLN